MKPRTCTLWLSAVGVGGGVGPAVGGVRGGLAWETGAGVGCRRGPSGVGGAQVGGHRLADRPSPGSRLSWRRTMPNRITLALPNNFLPTGAVGSIPRNMT